ncbi:MAG: Oxo-4-hydroxy-4-carboxy-5-ureidoimidazoline decarboxylase [Benniella sp.]|nr:MAG: Oxo-4-hydroxy-4-carboxy-5-ureidoimidazoline decarboxylase [Benniella sp.]
MAHVSALATLPPISDINEASSIERLVSAVTLLFEPAEPIVQHLYAKRPFASYTALIDETGTFLANPESLEHEARLEIINAHPRIGAPKANLSALSLIEQGYSAEDAAKLATQAATSQDDEATQAKLKELNERYEAKYGFKFVVFVNGRPRSEIIPVMESRIENSTEKQEMKTALDDMVAIARDRLKKLGAV